MKSARFWGRLGMKYNRIVYSLDQVCKRIYSGGTPSTACPEYWGGDINWLSSGETGQKYIKDTIKKITLLGVEKSATKLAKKGCTVVASAGQGFTRGQASFLLIDTYVNQSVIVFEPNEKIILPRYLFYNLDNRYEEFRLLSDGTSTRGGLSGWIVKRMEISLPPLKEQQQVVSLLQRIDEKIDLNNAINNNLQAQAFALFDELFPSFNDGDMQIGDYISPKRGKNLLSKDAIPGEVPVVAGGLEPATYHNVANTVAPVITISASGANAGFVNLWQKPVWSSDSSFIDSAMTDDVYFWFALLKKRQKEIYDSQTGSAQPHIYPQHISSMRLPSLNMDLVTEYVSRVKPFFALVGANLDESKHLASLRDSLLPKLMSGEIDVSDVEI